MNTRHDWHLSSLNNDGTFYGIAICRRCGLTRSGLISRGATERSIDLSGDCPTSEPVAEPFVIEGRPR